MEKPKNLYISYAPFLNSSSNDKGHYFLYQKNFLNYCSEINQEAVCLTGKYFKHNDRSFVKILENTELSNNLAKLEEFLRPLKNECIYFHVYEGRMEDLKPLAEFASRFSNIKFHLNLLRPSHGLATPAGKQYEKKLIRQFNHSGKVLLETPVNNVDIPNNLTLTAETKSRSLLAKSFGMNIENPIEIFSSLSDQPSKSNTGSGGHNFLIPYFIEDIDRRKFFNQMVSLRKLKGHNFTFKLLARKKSYSYFLRSIEKIANTRISIEIGSQTFEDYCELFEKADSVIFPEIKLYNTHSSGKVLDAICMGLPALTPSGTYHHKIYESWVPGIPSYRDNSDFLQCLAIWVQVHESIKLELDAKSIEIRSYYSSSRYFNDLFALFRK